MGQHDFTPVGAPPRNWFARHKALTAVLGVLALLVLLFVIPFGSDSGQGTDAAPSTQPSVFTQQTQASPGPCYTNTCIAEGMEKSLPGIVDTDGSVLTKASCKAATVKHNPNGSYTITCVASYSDGSAWRGFGTLQDDKVYFQAETEVR